jgi:hypothetical protein
LNRPHPHEKSETQRKISDETEASADCRIIALDGSLILSGNPPTNLFNQTIKQA